MCFSVSYALLWYLIISKCDTVFDCTFGYRITRKLYEFSHFRKEKQQHVDMDGNKTEVCIFLYKLVTRTTEWKWRLLVLVEHNSRMENLG